MRTLVAFQSVPSSDFYLIFEVSIICCGTHSLLLYVDTLTVITKDADWPFSSSTSYIIKLIIIEPKF